MLAAASLSCLKMRRNPPCPMKYMSPSRYTATSATTASGAMPMIMVCSANVPPMKPTSCSAYTMPPKNP